MRNRNLTSLSVVISGGFELNKQVCRFCWRHVVSGNPRGDIWIATHVDRSVHDRFNHRVVIALDNLLGGQRREETSKAEIEHDLSLEELIIFD
jgi:hypothetical protein